MLILPHTSRRATVDAMTGVGGILHGCKAKLFQNNKLPMPDDDASAYVECDFDGYTAGGVAVSWGKALTNALGQAVTIGTTIQFSCTGSTKPQLVYGYELVDATTGTTLIGAEAFDSPIPVNDVGDGVVLVPTFSFGQ